MSVGSWGTKFRKLFRSTGDELVTLGGSSLKADDFARGLDNISSDASTALRKSVIDALQEDNALATMSRRQIDNALDEVQDTLNDGLRQMRPDLDRAGRSKLIQDQMSKLEADVAIAKNPSAPSTNVADNVTRATVNASTDPTVIAQQARHTMDGMIRNLDPNVSLQNLDGAGMQGFADDFVRRMKEVNPEFDGLHRLDERGMRGLHVRMNDAMTATGNATEGGSSAFFSRFESAVNTRLSTPNANSAPIPDGMQVAVREGGPATDALTGNARRAIGETSEGGEIVTRADNFPATHTDDVVDNANSARRNGNADEATGNNNRGGDNNGGNNGGDTPRNPSSRMDDLQQQITENVAPLEIGLRSGRKFNVEETFRNIRTSMVDSGQLQQGASQGRTIRESLDAIENGDAITRGDLLDLEGFFQKQGFNKPPLTHATQSAPGPFEVTKPSTWRNPFSGNSNPVDNISRRDLKSTQLQANGASPLSAGIQSNMGRLVTGASAIVLAGSMGAQDYLYYKMDITFWNDEHDSFASGRWSAKYAANPEEWGPKIDDEMAKYGRGQLPAWLSKVDRERNESSMASNETQALSAEKTTDQQLAQERRDALTASPKEAGMPLSELTQRSSIAFSTHLDNLDVSSLQSEFTSMVSSYAKGDGILQENEFQQMWSAGELKNLYDRHGLPPADTSPVRQNVTYQTFDITN